MTKNNTKSYFIEIMPAGYYFFGGERTFLTVEKDKYGQEITNYFATSNLLPQQTTLLGMLRHLLLILYGKLDGTQEEKKDLIKEMCHLLQYSLQSLLLCNVRASHVIIT